MMSENEEIIELLKSINKHLKELDEVMTAMGKRIEHMDNSLYQYQTDQEFLAQDMIENPENYEKQPDPQLEKISEGLVAINKNICTFNKNEISHNKRIIDSLEGFRDEELSYFKTRTSHLNRIYDILKSIHIWNG